MKIQIIALMALLAFSGVAFAQDCKGQCLVIEADGKSHHCMPCEEW